MIWIACGDPRAPALFVLGGSCSGSIGADSDEWPTSHPDFTHLFDFVFRNWKPRRVATCQMHTNVVLSHLRTLKETELEGVTSVPSAHSFTLKWDGSTIRADINKMKIFWGVRQCSLVVKYEGTLFGDTFPWKMGKSWFIRNTDIQLPSYTEDGGFVVKYKPTQMVKYKPTQLHCTTSERAWF